MKGLSTCQVVAAPLCLLLVCAGADASALHPLRAIAKCETVVIGTLTEITWGTFARPHERVGKLTVMQTVKGDLTSPEITVRLPDDWRRASLPAAARRLSFWILALFLCLAAYCLFRAKRLGLLRTTAGVVSCLILALFILPITFSRASFSGWPKDPSYILNHRMLWTLYGRDSEGRHRGHPYRLGYVVRILHNLPSEKIRLFGGPKGSDPATQRAYRLLRDNWRESRRRPDSPANRGRP